MKRRHPFLLFEIAIGLTLIVLALGPMLGNTYQRLQREREALARLQQEWETDWQATEWHEKIAQHTLELPRKHDENLPLSQGWALTCTGEKTLPDTSLARLYSLTLGKRIYKFYRVEDK